MPIITISRQYCAGGSAIAEGVSRALGWSLLDNAVVDQVAARTGLSVSEVAAQDERRPSLAIRVANAMAMSTQDMLTPIASAKLPPSEQQLFDTTRHVIEEAVARGPVVVVGRGAQLALSSRSDVFAVFCYAPREALVRACMQRDSLDHDKASKLVDAVNRDRAAWVKAHWGREWEALENYHVCVNTDALTQQGAIELVVSGAKTYFEL